MIKISNAGYEFRGDTTSRLDARTPARAPVNKCAFRHIQKMTIMSFLANASRPPPFSRDFFASFLLLLHATR